MNHQEKIVKQKADYHKIILKWHCWQKDNNCYYQVMNNLKRWFGVCARKTVCYQLDDKYRHWKMVKKQKILIEYEITMQRRGKESWCHTSVRAMTVATKVSLIPRFTAICGQQKTKIKRIKAVQLNNKQFSWN